MTELHEREGEFAALAEAVSAARAGTGRLVLVEGPAGVGKSALLARVAADAAGTRVLWARGGELESGYAFGAVRQLFEPLLTGAGAERRARLLAGTAAPAAWVLGTNEGGEDRAGSAFAVSRGLLHLTAHLAGETPLLLVLDDVQWFDEPSIRWLDFLARRLSELPVCVLVGVRDEQAGPHAPVLDALRDQPGTTAVQPRRLSAAAVGVLVAEERPDADPALVAAYEAASTGNPLYLRELLRLGPISSAAVRGAAIPGVGDRMVRRVRGLDPQAPALAVAIAVLGGEGRPIQLVAELAQMPVPEAARVALLLQRSQILAAGDRLSFVHPIVRSSIYATLSASERVAVHGAAAALLIREGASAEAVAAHLASVPASGSQDLVDRLRAAADEALARAAPGIAAAHIQRALEEGAPRPDRAQLLFDLGRAQAATRDPASLATLRAARQAATEPGLLIAATVTLSELLAFAGMWEQAATVLQETRATVLAQAPAELVELDAVRAALMANDPALNGGLDGERGTLADAAGGDGWAARALAAVLGGVASARGEGRAATFALLDHALADGRLLERDGGGWPMGELVVTLIDHDEYVRALELCVRLDQAARASGRFAGQLTAGLGRGFVAARRGELVTAEAELRVGFDVAREAQMTMAVTSMAFGLVEALVERPGLADIAEMLDAVELEPRFAASASGAMLLMTRGRIALARGDRGRAVDELRGAAAVYAGLRHGPVRSAWRSALALAIAPDEPDEARRLATEELALARAAGARRPEGVALRAVGLLATGEEGIAALEASVRTLARTGSRYELALSTVELGAALRRARLRTRARDALTSGMDLAAQCGAGRLVAHAEVELKAAGARPRRHASTGVSALTASEARIAALAVAGHSNVEIAHKLYIGVKTVESHLSHTYAKLGLAGQGSRAQLQAALMIEAKVEETRASPDAR